MKKSGSSFIISLLITAVIGYLLYYIALPAATLQSIGFWLYSIVILVIYTVISSILNGDAYTTSIGTRVAGGLALVLIVLLLLLSLFGSSTLFKARAYSDILEKDIKTEDISTYSPTLNTVPLLDKDSAMMIMNRKMGSLEDVISQFELKDNEQITITGKPYRVALLDYAGFFKWLNNKVNGIPGYMLIDMQTQTAELVRLEEGVKYSHSEYFSRDITRYLRFNYPTKMFGEISLELNDEKEPYWVVATMENKVGLFGGRDVSGVIAVNAVDGKISEYKLGEVPKWVDNIYSSAMLMTHYDYYGKFQEGFWNTLFGQQGVKVTTEGYNYIPIGDDNWIYTGVTSVVSDESNIGFLLMNKRTKETIYYPLAGAEEYSAMSSSEGVVQHLGYTATFPLLLQIEEQPTYLVALKDAGGLVKMYGMVNIERYQIVATGNTINETKQKYRELLVENGILVPEVEEEVEEVKEEIVKVIESGEIEEVREFIKDGMTYKYIKFINNAKYYEVNIKTSPMLPFAEVGKTIKVEYDKRLFGTTDKIIPAAICE